jgi:D-alanyl-D-alanine carboxypeptidase
LNLTSYIGGKNGYTPEANRTGLSIFKLGSKEKIFSVIILGSSMRDNDTLDLLDEAVM